MKPTNTQADPDDLWQITDFQLNALRYLKPHRIVCLLRVRPRCTGSTNLPSVPAFPYDVFRKDYNHPHDLKDLRSRIQGALYYYSNVTAGVDKFCGSRIVGFYRNGKAYAIGKHVQLIDDLTEEGVLGGQSSAVPEFIVLHRPPKKWYETWGSRTHATQETCEKLLRDGVVMWPELIDGTNPTRIIVTKPKVKDVGEAGSVVENDVTGLLERPE